MDVTIKSWTVDEAQGDLVAVFLLDGGPADLHPLVQQAVESKDMTGANNTALLIPAYRTLGAKRLMIAGLGKPGELTVDRVRKASATIITKAKELKLKTVSIILPDVSLDDLQLVTAIAEGAILADYSFSKHTDPLHEKLQHVQTLHIGVGEKDVKPLAEQAARTVTVCGDVKFVRDLERHSGAETQPAICCRQVGQDSAQTDSDGVQRSSWVRR
jgi:leucyl aminopeptidase